MTEVFSVSCSLIFTLSSLCCSTPLSYPLILPLCLCEEACTPAETGCRDARGKDSREECFLNPSCPPGLMQCISLLLGSLSGAPGGPLLQTLPTKMFESPTLFKISSSSQCYFPLLFLGRVRWELSVPNYLLFVVFSFPTHHMLILGQEPFTTIITYRCAGNCPTAACRQLSF